MKKFLTIAVLALTLTTLSACSWITDKVNEKVGEVNEGISDVAGEASGDFKDEEDANAPKEVDISVSADGEVSVDEAAPAGE